MKRIPLKHVATLNDEVLPESFPPNALIKYAEVSDVSQGQPIQWKDPMPFVQAPSRARRIVKHNDILISTVRTYLRAVTQVEHPPPCAVASTGFAVVRPRTAESKYLGYILQSDAFIDEVVSQSVGVSYPAISPREIARIKIPFPEIEKQQNIAVFLDRETAEIDAFIADQEQLIELLEERRDATITHAVTKGLDPTVPMKDSGVEWIDEIPEHWHVLPIKRVASIRGRIGFRGYTTSDLVEAGEGAVSLSPGNMRAGVLQWDESTYISWKKYYESPEIMVASGDTLLVKTGSTFGKASYAELPQGYSATINPQIVILRPQQIESRFFFHSVSNNRVYNEFRSYPTGGTTPTMTENRIGSIQIALPGLAEQRQIATYLNSETREIDAAIADAREAISLSRERRAALISAAVTGQLDVTQMSSRESIGEVLEDEVRV